MAYSKYTLTYKYDLPSIVLSIKIKNPINNYKFIEDPLCVCKPQNGFL